MMISKNQEGGLIHNSFAFFWRFIQMPIQHLFALKFWSNIVSFSKSDTGTKYLLKLVIVAHIQFFKFSTFFSSMLQCRGGLSINSMSTPGYLRPRALRDWKQHSGCLPLSSRLRGKILWKRHRYWGKYFCVLIKGKDFKHCSELGVLSHVHDTAILDYLLD